MKKLWTLLLLLALWPCYAARDFDATTSVLACGSETKLDDLSAFTYTAWVFPDGWGENNFGRIIDKATSTTSGKSFTLDNSTVGGTAVRGLQCFIDGTTDGRAEAVTDSMVLSAWQFVACTWAGGDVAPRLWRGTPGGVVAELTLNTNTAVATVTTEAAATFRIGNDASSARTFDGQLANVRVFNAAIVTAAELTSIMYNRPTRLDAQVGFWPMFGAASTDAEPDWSGIATISNCAATAAPALNGPPIPPHFVGR